MPLPRNSYLDTYPTLKDTHSEKNSNSNFRTPDQRPSLAVGASPPTAAQSLQPGFNFFTPWQPAALAPSLFQTAEPRQADTQNLPKFHSSSDVSRLSDRSEPSLADAAPSKKRPFNLVFPETPGPRQAPKRKAVEAATSPGGATAALLQTEDTDLLQTLLLRALQIVDRAAAAKRTASVQAQAPATTATVMDGPPLL